MTGGVAGRHLGLALLTLVSLVSYVDRQIIALVAPDIQRDLALADWQIGFVTGTSFAVLYVAMGIPLSYVADRRRRVPLLALCLGAWSVMTALCGAAHSFVQLSLARIGVAIGEAGGYPASLSLISDLYPRHQRAIVTSIFFAAVPAGTLLSLAVGGMVADAIGWRLTFVAAAVPGLILAIVLPLLMREPRRGATEPGGHVPAPAAGSLAQAARLLGSTLARLMSDPVYRLVAIGGAIGSIELFAIVVWSPSFAIRRFGLDKTTVGQGLGLATGLIAAATMILCGALADRLAKRLAAAPLYIAAAGHLCCVVLLFLALRTPDFTTFCVLAALAYGAAASAGPMTIAATQARVDPAVRATAAALVVMLSTLAGYGLGPPLIGAISDAATGDRASRLATGLLAGLGATIVAALLIAMAARYMKEER